MGGDISHYLELYSRCRRSNVGPKDSRRIYKVKRFEEDSMRRDLSQYLELNSSPVDEQRTSDQTLRRLIEVVEEQKKTADMMAEILRKLEQEQRAVKKLLEELRIRNNHTFRSSGRLSDRDSMDDQLAKTSTISDETEKDSFAVDIDVLLENFSTFGMGEKREKGQVVFCSEEENRPTHEVNALEVKDGFEVKVAASDDEWDFATESTFVNVMKRELNRNDVQAANALAYRFEHIHGGLVDDNRHDIGINAAISDEIRSDDNESLLSSDRKIKIVPHKQAIVGLTVVGNKIFVVLSHYKKINVYDSQSLTTSHDIKVPDMQTPVALAGCSYSKALYISDVELKLIHRVDLIDYSVSLWKMKENETVGHKPHGLSVTAEHTLLVNVVNFKSLRAESGVVEYASDGRRVREIKFDRSIDCAHHTIRLSSNQSIVCHGTPLSTQRRVCVINNEGQIIKCYDGKAGPGEDLADEVFPCSLAIDDNNKRVFVADCANNKVLQLDTDLMYVGQVHTPHDLREPYRLHYDSSSNRLLIGEVSGRLLVLSSVAVLDHGTDCDVVRVSDNLHKRAVELMKDDKKDVRIEYEKQLKFIESPTHSADDILKRVGSVVYKPHIDKKEKLQEKFDIGEKEETEILRAIEELRMKPEFTLRIPNINFESDRVMIYYLVKQDDHKELNHPSNDNSQEEFNSKESTNLDRLMEVEKKLKQSYLRSVMPPRFRKDHNPEDSKRDVNILRESVQRIIPNASPDLISIIELKQMPRFVPTNGLSSVLNKIDEQNIRHRVGVISAFVSGQLTTTDFALTIGHGLLRGDIIYIGGVGGPSRIGVVQEVIVNNDDGYEYVDAALIKLEPDAILNLGLQQQFLIGNEPYSLWITNGEPAETGRVVIRAVDQKVNDIRGFISSTSFTIRDDQGASMYRCIRIARYAEDQKHKGIIHEPGQSGLLCTYEPNPPDQGNKVKPVVILIGFYPDFDENGEIASHSSIGVDMHRVCLRFGDSENVGEKLAMRHIDS